MTHDEIQKLASLARIRITDEEADTLSEEFETILDYVGQIQDVSAAEIEKRAGEHRNIFREDGEPHETGLYTDTLLKAAPNTEKQHIRVKKIIS